MDDATAPLFVFQVSVMTCRYYSHYIYERKSPPASEYRGDHVVGFLYLAKTSSQAELPVLASVTGDVLLESIEPLARRTLLILAC